MVGFDSYRVSRTVNGKWHCTGNFYKTGRHGYFRQATYDVWVPHRERIYLVYIFPTMLSAYGGDFDQADTIFTDIYSIDGIRRDSSNGYGGVWGHHWASYGSYKNQAISAYVGYINHYIRFRIAIQGDNHVGASFIIQEL